MGINIDPELFVAFLLVTIRASAWTAISPPFAGNVPVKVRIAFSVSLGLLLAEKVSQTPDLPMDDTTTLIGTILFQVAIGVAMGLLTQILYSAVASAGAAIDMFAGLQSAQMFDPALQQTSGPMSRMFTALAGLVLFGTGGHLLLVGGFARTFDAAPVSGLRLDRLGVLLTHDLGQMMLAILQIGAPVLGALFVTELLLALASKAAPQLNIMIVGFGAKALVMFVFATACMPLIVVSVPKLVADSVRSMAALVGG
jgi:flagellar biosynthetic protein FliR